MLHSETKRTNKRLHSFFEFLRFSSKRGTFFVFLGVVFITLSIFWRVYQSRILSFTKEYPEEVQAAEQVESEPVRIFIDSIELDLSIEESQINDGVWEISFDGASHLDKSASPGEGGNVVIYGHNKKSLFGPILGLKVGSIIGVESDKGEIFSYRVTQSITVNPENIEYVLPKDEEVLTLYTCTGFADSKRQIVIAEPVLED